MDESAISVADVTAVASALSDALAAAGATHSADVLAVAAATEGDDRSRLLELRSALVVTRSDWEGQIDVELRNEAVAALKAAKRLAIEL